MIDYDDLISRIIDEIKKNKIKLSDDIHILRNENGIIVDYCLKDPRSDSSKKAQVKSVLQEMMKENSILKLISIKDYAFLNGINHKTAAQKAARGGYETAKKIAGVWFIDPFEENTDLRYKDNKRQ